MDKYKGKYRIQSHRKPNWDYSEDALYFLTIVTQNRECNLGDIIKMDNSAYLETSEMGKIVEHEWFKSFDIRNELILHEFVLMPNHLHAIVEIRHEFGDDGGDLNGLELGDGVLDGSVVDGSVVGGTVIGGNDLDGLFAETHGRVSLPVDGGINGHQNEILSIKRNQPVRLPKSISSFISGFKSAVNTKIDDYIDENKLSIPKYNRNNHFFQPNYHDHIIRGENEYITISNYIKNNPLNWNKDKFHGN